MQRVTHTTFTLRRKQCSPRIYPDRNWMTLATYGQTTYLEAPHLEKTKSNRLKNQKNALAHRSEVCVVSGEQTANLQNYNMPYMDIRLNSGGEFQLFKCTTSWAPSAIYRTARCTMTSTPHIRHDVIK